MQVPACDMHVSYMVSAGLKNMHFGNMHATYMFPGQYIDIQHAHCVLHACCMLCAYDMHIVYELLIHVAIFFALPYNYNIYMTRACPV